MIKLIKIICLLLLGIITVASAGGLRGSANVAVPEVEDEIEDFYGDIDEDFDEEGRQLGNYKYRKRRYNYNSYNCKHYGLSLIHI